MRVVGSQQVGCSRLLTPHCRSLKQSFLEESDANNPCPCPETASLWLLVERLEKRALLQGKRGGAPSFWERLSESWIWSAGWPRGCSGERSEPVDPPGGPDMMEVVLGHSWQGDLQKTGHSERRVGRAAKALLAGLASVAGLETPVACG